MTPLADLLIRRIAATGPLSVAEYMADCLLHPEHGYYTTQVPFGAEGDFTTAPEISQMFGEMLGLCLVQSWLDQGRPTPFVLAELGPGRGTLMADVLRATAQVAGFHAAAQIWLVEASDRLRGVQRATLAGHVVNWAASLNDLPDLPMFAVANEFFDALPIRQFTRDAGGWREHQIGAVDGALAMGLSAAAPLQALDHRLADTQPGDIVETCAAGAAITRALAGRIAGKGGAAIIVDYGDWHSLGDTLQAMRAHAPDPVLAHPGRADLTAHVDFEALAQAARAAGAAVSAMTPQGVLMERLGITARAKRLAEGLGGKALDSHIAAHRRLVHPQEMGLLFKAIALYAATSHCPPGFD